MSFPILHNLSNPRAPEPQKIGAVLGSQIASSYQVNGASPALSLVEQANVLLVKRADVVETVSNRAWKHKRQRFSLLLWF